MPTIYFPPTDVIFDNSSSVERQQRIRDYYEDEATDIAVLVARLYSGKDITPLYDQILFRQVSDDTPFVFDIEVVSTGADAGADSNILVRRSA